VWVKGEGAPAPRHAVGDPGRHRCGPLPDRSLTVLQRPRPARQRIGKTTLLEGLVGLLQQHCAGGGKGANRAASRGPSHAARLPRPRTQQRVPVGSADAMAPTASPAAPVP